MAFDEEGEVIENCRMLHGYKAHLEVDMDNLGETLAKDDVTDDGMFDHECWYESTGDSLRRLEEYHKARSLPEEVPMLPGNSSVN